MHPYINYLFIYLHINLSICTSIYSVYLPIPLRFIYLSNTPLLFNKKVFKQNVVYLGPCCVAVDRPKILQNVQQKFWYKKTLHP